MLLVLLFGYWFFGNQGARKYQFVTASRGPITETVSVTGNTKPVESVSLGFGTSGTIARVYASVGKHVSRGDILAALNMSSLSAELKQAQADVDTQKAKLAGLEAGSRPEDVAAAQAAYDKSAQDLANLYAGISDTRADAYTKANDAVRIQLSAFFSNAEGAQPKLSFSTVNSQSANDAESGRVSAGVILKNWQSELFSVASSSAHSQFLLDSAIQDDLGRLSTISLFLQNVSSALNGASSLSQATLATYQADLADALSETNTAIKNLSTASQGIASQKLTVAQLKAELDLTKAGSTSEDIAAQKAQVEQSEASLESVRAKVQDSQIIAPQSGVVTEFDAKVGQRATAGASLISIISESALEVETEVPETDIGKVAVGDTVNMTFDAFPNDTFLGSVLYINPAETIAQGVVSYKVKISFQKPDSRLKSGLTANLDIETEHKDNALVLPQYAILQNDQGTFVEVLENGTVMQVPVTLGIADSKGNVEILSGVSEGQEVLNIGLKQ